MLYYIVGFAVIRVLSSNSYVRYYTGFIIVLFRKIRRSRLDARIRRRAHCGRHHVVTTKSSLVVVLNAIFTMIFIPIHVIIARCPLRISILLSYVTMFIRVHNLCDDLRVQQIIRARALDIFNYHNEYYRRLDLIYCTR